MSNPAFDTFCDELDALIDKWRDKPEDDRLSYAEIAGALTFIQYTLATEAMNNGVEKEDF